MKVLPGVHADADSKAMVGTVYADVRTVVIDRIEKANMVLKVNAVWLDAGGGLGCGWLRVYLT